MDIFQTILESEEFKARPPVLFDVGASSRLIEPWQRIARHCIVVAFDPDCRLTGYIEKADPRYRKLFFIPRIVAAESSGETDFYLTASPECSSCLKPNFPELKNWNHAGFFELSRKERFKSITISEALAEVNLDRIDGFKIDAQGADLRIYRSIPPHIRAGISAVEIEPTIMDAYVGEDTLYDVLSYFNREEKGFGVFDLRVQKAYYLPTALSARYLSPLQRRLVPTCHTAAPGWTEVTLLRRPEALPDSPRAFQTAWIFAMLYRQYGLALQIADAGQKRFPAAIFERMTAESISQVPFWRPVLKKCLTKLLRKITGT